MLRRNISGDDDPLSICPSVIEELMQAPHKQTGLVRDLYAEVIENKQVDIKHELKQFVIVTSTHNLEA